MLEEFANFGQGLAALLVILGAIFIATRWIVLSIINLQHAMEDIDKRHSEWRHEAKRNLDDVKATVNAINVRSIKNSEKIATIEGRLKA